MKKVLFLLLCIVYSALCIQAQEGEDRGYIVKVGDMAPDFTLKMDNGKTIHLSELRGKVVMLQFTASWCGICRKEMPYIESDIWQKHKNNKRNLCKTGRPGKGRRHPVYLRNRQGFLRV